MTCHGPAITRLPACVVKVWAKRQQAWSLLIQADVDLRSLIFLGSLRNQHFPANALIFHLVDGVYSLNISSKILPPKQGQPLPTSSYGALMKLSTLDNSIQDAITTQERIAAQINAIRQDTATNELPQAREQVKLANKYVAQETRALKSAKKRRDELIESLNARREAIQKGRSLQEKAEADVANAMEKLRASREMVVQTKEQIHGQRRRISSDLADVFQIIPTPSGVPLSFQICGISLPNTTGDTVAASGSNEDSLSAALGYVATLTNALQFYLSVPLPYPLSPYGSRSSVRDEISLLTDLNPQQQARQRDFPLHLPRGGSTAAQFRFDYGWFLLNKDIEALCASQGLKVVDIRHTLPNLKYLLYVCSAGTDEVPERKRGGVRGLWAGRLKGRIATSVTGDGDSSSYAGSRRGSIDSELANRQRDELRNALKHEGAGLIVPESGGLSPISLPFDEEETRLTLRTKSFRATGGR
jgi:UV radiation resistance-associated gene protein